MRSQKLQLEFYVPTFDMIKLKIGYFQGCILVSTFKYLFMLVFQVFS